MNRYHAVLAPSAAYRWTKCPGSVTLTSGIPEVESEYARKGTEAHLVAAARLEYELFGKTLPTDLPILTEEYLDCVETYLDHARKTAKRVGKNATILIEHKLKAPHEVKEVWGTGDFIAFSSTRLVVIDLKTGVVPVEVDNNLQMIVYAGLARAEFGLKPREIEIHVVQPRAYHADGPIRVMNLSVTDLNDHWRFIRVMADIAMSDHGKKMFASGPHCRFCPAEGSCRTRAQQSLIEDFTEEDSLWKANLMSNRELGEMLNRIELVESIAGAIKKEAEARALRGQAIYGHKLVRKGSKRQWVDEAMVKELLEKAGFDRELFVDEVLKSFTLLEKDQLMAPLIRPYIKYPPGQPALVPASDKRPELDPHEEAKREFAEKI